MRVLLVQRTLDPPGGGNAVAAWMLHALAGAHEVTTLTERPWEAQTVDAFYGTALASAGIRQRTPQGAAARLAHTRWRAERLRMAWLMRDAARVSGEFDLLITADNYAAFNRPGIQYLHYPAALRPEPARLAPLVHLYYRACDAISGLTWEAARNNFSLANSQWTARHLQQFHGIGAAVLYPPVVDPGGGAPWADRANRFLSIGRFHGSKRLEMVVSILDRVRSQDFDVSLTMAGSNVDADYMHRLQRLASDRPWVTLREDLTQAELFSLMRKSRYGIHAMDREHFGMAAAEMARAGCVVFGHASGGLVEVLDDRRELLWDTPERAVQLIVAMLKDEERQQAMSAHLRAHAARFSVERFAQEFRAIVLRHARGTWQG